MTKNGHPLSGLSCDNGKVDLAIHQSCGSSKAAFLDMGKIHGNKLVFHVAANIQELSSLLSHQKDTRTIHRTTIHATCQNTHCLSVTPSSTGSPLFAALRHFPPLEMRTCYHAYGSCEAILPLRSLVLAGKTPRP